MLVTVRFFGDLREYIKKRWLTVEVPESTSVRDLILRVEKDLDLSLSDKLMDKDEVNPRFKILVNGTNILHMKGLETRLGDRYSVTIIPTAGGG